MLFFDLPLSLKAPGLPHVQIKISITVGAKANCSIIVQEVFFVDLKCLVKQVQFLC